MVVVGISRWLALSLVALAVSGGVDMVSMNIRSMTVAWPAPTRCAGA